MSFHGANPTGHYIGVRSGINEEEIDIDFQRLQVTDERASEWLASEMFGAQQRVRDRVAAPDHAAERRYDFTQATVDRGAASAWYRVATPSYVAEESDDFLITRSYARSTESEGSRVPAPEYAGEEREDSASVTMLRTPAVFSSRRRPGPAGGGALSEDFHSPQRDNTPPHYLFDGQTPRSAAGRATVNHPTLLSTPTSTARAPPRGHVKLPQYSGEEPIESYRIQVELAAQLNGWSDAETAMGLAVALKGRAAQVLTSLRKEERLNYNVLMGALEQRFGRPVSMDEAMSKLFARVRGEKEGLGAYAAEIQELTLRSYPGYPRELQEDLARTAFVRGLRPYRLKEHIGVFGPRTFREALREAERVESMLWVPNRTPSAPAYVRQAEWVEDQSDEEEVVQSAAPTPPPPRQEKKTAKRRQFSDRSQAGCYRCGEPGHIARNCPAPAPLKPPTAPALNERRAAQ